MHIENRAEMPETAERDFIGEIKAQFQRDLDIKTILDGKAANMITMSSAIATFLLAIATFVVTNINPAHVFYEIAILFVIAGIVLATSAISFFVRSFTIRNYAYPVGHERFFENNVYNKEMADRFRTATKDEFNEHLIEEYLGSIKTNAKSNLEKANRLKYGQWLFFGLVLSISILLGSLLILALDIIPDLAV
jgi:uncharacterized protein YnzC (UPF0291/DUF896 family)